MGNLGLSVILIVSCMAIFVCPVTHVSCTVCYYMFMAQDSDPGAMNPVYNAHHNGEVPPLMPDYHPSQFGQGKVLNEIVDIILLSNEGSKQVILTMFRCQRFLVIPWNGMYMSHFAYACKMRYPLNLVLESWEYLWFY